MRNISTRPMSGARGLDVCEQPLGQDGECPGEEVKLTFPEALERMLKQNGYKLEK
jgi:hypothetical protein